MSTNNNIDNLFAGKLKAHENTPSPEAWAKLENELNNRKESKYGSYLKFAASVLILLSIGTWYFVGNNPEVESIAYSPDLKVNHPVLNTEKFDYQNKQLWLLMRFMSIKKKKVCARCNRLIHLRIYQTS